MQTMKNTLKINNPYSQLGLLIGGLLIVAIIAVFVYWVFHTKQSVLFSGLDQRDAATIVEELKSMDVSFKLENGGTTILVPEDMVYNVRLQLMNSETKLISGVGFELFDKSDFGMTEFVQKINFQRALQGELTRTITSLKEVKYARVHLVLPEHSLFNREDDKSRASVTLFLKDGESIGADQVLGIQRLVASAVPNMDVSAVAVVDQSGVTLSRGATNKNGAIDAGERLRRRQEVEEYLSHKVNEVLAKAFGPNQAMVSIDVTLNLEQIKTTVEDYLPNVKGEKGVVRKRETKSLPTNEKTKSGSVTTEVEYKLGRKVEQIVNTPGSIKSISVGVLVPEESTEQRIYQIEELVAVTVGLNKARGDEIVVHAINMAGVGQHQTSPVRSFQNYPIPLQGKIDSDQAWDSSLNPSDFSIDTLNRNAADTVAISDQGMTFSASHIQTAGNIYKEFKNRAQNGDILALGIIVLVVLIFAFTILWLVAANKRQVENTMSMEERERLLRQLNAWLESDKKTPEESRAL